MKIDRIELREIHLQLVAPFETSFGVTTERRIILVKVFSEGLHGWGECTCNEGPFYNHEGTDTAWLVLRDYVAPYTIGKEINTPEDASGLSASIRGNKMARAAVETAIWDLEAKRRGIPLWQLLGGTQEEIPCGVSLGLQATDAALLKKVETELAAGYQRIKLKIKPGRDYEMVKAVRKEHPNIRLTVDANSAYTLGDIETLRRLDEFNLMLIEQPLAYDDIIDHAELQRQIKSPICLDESILSVDDARKALGIGACRIINIKLGRVAGHTESRKIETYCRERGVPVWCGGMLEAGIGRAHNIAMATEAGFVLPGDVSASKRYWTEDIIIPEVEVSPAGTIRRPTGPGIGFEVNEKRIEALTVRKEVIG
ncbi:MAG: o-succinylbenzoate synthase [Acidobacteria bacterium]|nr:o-succinylbenzoate synthase [Acidobacteriota bacterium]MBK7597820.1 o-succinylbenzoate synthase [Acidobacteriota bacterium]MBK8315598.1 o-succinylbenzoate synthase [Acidobacteriota bacterium]